MLADATDTEWTKLCIRHADCILVVGDAAELANAHQLSVVERKLLFINRTENKGDGGGGGGGGGGGESFRFFVCFVFFCPVYRPID